MGGVGLGGWPRGIAVPVVLLAGLAAGSLWALGPTILRLRFGVLEVISTLLLGLRRPGRRQLDGAGPTAGVRHVYLASDPLPLAARLLGILEPAPSGPLVLASVPGISHVGLRELKKPWRAASSKPTVSIRWRRKSWAASTPGGCSPWHWVHPGAGWPGRWLRGERYELRAVPEPLAGIRVHRNRSGPPGGLDPMATIATGLLFAALEAGSSAMQREAQVPAVVVWVAEARSSSQCFWPTARRRRSAQLGQGS